MKKINAQKVRIGRKVFYPWPTQDDSGFILYNRLELQAECNADYELELNGNLSMLGKFQETLSVEKMKEIAEKARINNEEN